MKIKTRINIEELGRRLLSENEMREHRIILTEENASMLTYCMDIFLDEMLKADIKKEKKEYTYLYNNFYEDVGETVANNQALADEE